MVGNEGLFKNEEKHDDLTENKKVELSQNIGAEENDQNDAHQINMIDDFIDGEIEDTQDFTTGTKILES